MILHLDGLAFLVIHQSAMSINLSYMQLRGIISISIGKLSKIAKTGISPMHVLSPMPLPISLISEPYTWELTIF